MGEGGLGERSIINKGAGNGAPFFFFFSSSPAPAPPTRFSLLCAITLALQARGSLLALSHQGRLAHCDEAKVLTGAKRERVRIRPGRARVSLIGFCLSLSLSFERKNEGAWGLEFFSSLALSPLKMSLSLPHRFVSFKSLSFFQRLRMTMSNDGAAPAPAPGLVSKSSTVRYERETILAPIPRMNPEHIRSIAKAAASF